MARDPVMGYKHTKECIDEEIKHLRKLPPGDMHIASNLTIGKRIEQLLGAIEAGVWHNGVWFPSESYEQIKEELQEEEQ